ncbi:MAG: dTDP-glucose 4,6-dehydratase [Patescibacteria group bacterium]|nr:MAG: dTDP-glucose 4,6-dehydratase [Patescibacteria group bacterium]
MNILVTGGAGFIGSNFIHYWLAHHPQDYLVNYDKLTYAGNLENLKDIADNPHYTFVQGDVCNFEQLQITCTDYNIDTIVHFAAESHVDRSIIGPAIFAHNNVLGTLNVLEVARNLENIRVHHVSTDEVFGTLELNSSNKFQEDTPFRPNSPYAASKAASDHFVRAYYQTYQLPVTITNCSNNYGPYMFPEKLFPLAITNLLEGQKIPIYGRGNQVRDWLYVTDHCRAIDLVLHRGQLGQTYCVGGLEEEYTNLEAIKIICQILQKDFDSSVEYVKDRPGHDVRYAVNFSKIKTELGWTPQVTLTEGLKQTIQWYQDHNSWWQNVKSGAYQEYYRKQYQK